MQCHLEARPRLPMLAKQIELAPKNGDFVVLQDGCSGSWEVGRWAPESGSWVRIDGKPLRIFPTHWVSASGDSVGSENTEGLPFLVPAIPPPKRLRVRFILAFTVAAIFFFGGFTIEADRCETPPQLSVEAPSRRGSKCDFSASNRSRAFSMPAIAASL